MIFFFFFFVLDFSELDIRVGTNTAIDFLRSLLRMISIGFITRGDVVVADNASVHDAQHVLPRLYMTLRRVGVKLVFL